MRIQTDTGFPFGGETAWRVGAVVARRLTSVWFPVTHSGPDLPPGPVVVAANHFSHLDPVVLGATVRRPMRYLAVDELFGNSRIFDTLITWVGAIPMTRTRVPFGPLKLALGVLADGGTVGLFPEGVRVWTWEERAPKRGAAWLARRAGVPLVPVAITGTDVAMGRGASRILRAPIHVAVCEAIEPEDFESLSDPTRAMMREWSVRVDGALRRHQ